MKMIISKDNKEFKNLSKFCKAYKLNYSTTYNKLKKGKTIKEIKQIKNIKITDHLGKEYASIQEMCDSYNINYHTYRNRIIRGISQEEALNGNFKNHAIKEITDFQGITHKSVKTMCEYYGVKYNTYRQNLLRGKTEKEALTGGRKNNPYYDHKGNKYDTKAEMCKQYGLNATTYMNRIKKGWSVEKALTTKPNESKEYYVTDHLGNVFNTQKEMCDAWNILINTYRSRIKKGWSIEKALTTPLNQPKKQITDHLGNEFLSISKMCEFHNININVYNARLKLGWTQKKALTTPINYIKINNIKGTYVDTYNNQYYYKCKLPNSEQKQILTLEQINNYKEH